MSINGQSVTFRWKSKSLDFSWSIVGKELGMVRCSRITENHSLWKKYDGKGYSIFLSDVVIYDSSNNSVEWEATMESLSKLTDDGIETWNLFKSTIHGFLTDAGIEPEEV
ncbi:MAG: hypothetical protein HRU38_02790 [Saccharospirillaceae bacterium]|nr:hypothetical protein [Pseudomonadales bacterium]NRB77589.1 hypothetical protein [Saccharospirillaceae bacterium]